MKELLRVGIAGARPIARFHARGVIECPLTELVAVADPSTPTVEEFDAFVREAGFTGEYAVFDDYRTLVDEGQIDALIIALPTHLHAAASIYALDRGLHVMCEKPPTSSAEEMGKVADAAAKSGRTYMFARAQRFGAATLEAERRVRDGELGTVYHARSEWIRTKGIPFRNGFGVSRNHGGGVLLDLGVHMLDDAWFILGRPEPVSVSAVTHCAFARLLPDDAQAPYDADDAMFALVRFANGATASISATFALNVPAEKGSTDDRPFPDVRTLQVYGDRTGLDVLQKLVVDNSGDALRTDEMALREEFAGPESAFVRQLTEFVNAIRESREPTSSIGQAIDLMKMLDAFRASAKTGTSVDA